jgi:hypothetical protein
MSPRRENTYMVHRSIRYPGENAVSRVGRGLAGSRRTCRRREGDD